MEQLEDRLNLPQHQGEDVDACIARRRAEIMETCENMLEQYRPVLSNMFDVDLSGIELDSAENFSKEYTPIFRREVWNDFLQSIRDREFWNIKELLLNGLRIVCVRPALNYFMKKKRDKFTDAMYVSGLNKVYVFDKTLLEASHAKLGRIVVHELAHAVEEAFFSKDDIPKDVLRYLGEGLCEYIALNLFEPHYGIEGMGPYLRDEGGSHMEMREHQDDLDSFVERMSSMGFEVEIRMSSIGFEKAKDIDKYPIGYVFFKEAVNAGYRMADILSHPPIDVEMVRKPELYCRWLEDNLTQDTTKAL